MNFTWSPKKPAAQKLGDLVPGDVFWQLEFGADTLYMVVDKADYLDVKRRYAVGAAEEVLVVNLTSNTDLLAFVVCMFESFREVFVVKATLNIE